MVWKVVKSAQPPVRYRPNSDRRPDIVCDAPRLVRVDTAWCTPTSSMHNAAYTIPVIECTQEPFECFVYSSHSN